MRLRGLGRPGRALSVVLGGLAIATVAGVPAGLLHWPVLALVSPLAFCLTATSVTGLASGCGADIKVLYVDQQFPAARQHDAQ